MAERAPATKEDVTPSNDTEEKAPPAPQSSATMPPAVNNDDSLRPGTASSSKSASGGIEVVAKVRMEPELGLGMALGLSKPIEISEKRKVKCVGASAPH